MKQLVVLLSFLLLPGCSMLNGGPGKIELQYGDIRYVSTKDVDVTFTREGEKVSVTVSSSATNPMMVHAKTTGEQMKAATLLLDKALNKLP